MSGGFYQAGTYSMSVRRRNRAVILTLSGIPIAIIAYRLVVHNVGLGRSASQVGVVLFFGACMWWAVASQAAGPVKIDPNTTYYLRSIFKGRTRN